MNSQYELNFNYEKKVEPTSFYPYLLTIQYKGEEGLYKRILEVSEKQNLTLWIMEEPVFPVIQNFMSNFSKKTGPVIPRVSIRQGYDPLDEKPGKTSFSLYKVLNGEDVIAFHTSEGLNSFNQGIINVIEGFTNDQKKIYYKLLKESEKIGTL